MTASVMQRFMRFQARKRVARLRKVVVEEEDRGMLCQRLTINALPDDTLIEIFSFYVGSQCHDEDAWHTLVHVCQNWRCIVFSSPRRLHLRLLCTNRRSRKHTLDIWPPFPIIILAGRSIYESQWSGMANVISALEQHDRVCKISISDPPNLLLKIFAAMKEPFPALTYLMLRSKDVNVPVLPETFLGGSAPRLQYIHLEGFQFPELLLLQLTDLVTLSFCDIPLSGYISPEAMATSLCALTRLEQLTLEFHFPRPRAQAYQERPPPLTRIVLPALSSLRFRGDGDYLENIVSRIETPTLSRINITFFNQVIFDTPHLGQFIGCIEEPRAFDHAEVFFDEDYARLTLSPQNETKNDRELALNISCKPSDWQLVSLSQICSMCLPSFSTLKSLKINADRQDWQNGMEDTWVELILWLELLRHFNSVEDLFLSKALSRLVAPALQELAERSDVSVLPALQKLSLAEPQSPKPVAEAIEKFIAARQLSGRPVVVHHRDEGLRWEVSNQEIPSASI